jgi:rod shape-determining protein MreC
MTRARRLNWHDQLFFILLALSVGLYCLNRFFQVRLFALPAMVILAPRTLVGGMIETARTLRTERDSLAELCKRQQLENAFWREQAGARARETLGTRYNLVKAEVIGRDPQTLRQTLIVDRGLLNGVRTGMVAITDAGVAGRVIEVGANIAFVATLPNPRVKLAALDARSRVAGVVSAREGALLGLDYVLPEMDIAAGDTVITSGTGGVFPKGLRIGLVVKADSAPRGLFRPILIRPFVNAGSLERVYLIEAQDWQAVEHRQQQEAAELRRRQQNDLERLLEESKVER